jgi:hypothetical protein
MNLIMMILDIPLDPERRCFTPPQKAVLGAAEWVKIF